MMTSKTIYIDTTTAAPELRFPEFHDDWQVKTLGEIAEIKNGDRSEKYPKPNEIQKQGIPFINAGHIVNGEIDFLNMDYISTNKYDSMGGAKLQKDDILFCLRGSLGKNAMVSFEKGALASSLCVIRPKEINSFYLFL